MKSKPLSVLKFGASILRSVDDLLTAALEIHRELVLGRRVVAVVSAFAGATDELIAHADRFRVVDPTQLARWLATGEATSAALLALQLDEVGIPAQVLDPHCVSLRTIGPVLDGMPCDVDAEAFAKAFETTDIVIVSGFVGCDETGRTTLLGRGGSDLTAIFLAHRLGSMTCRLVKDVPGLYPVDPKSDRKAAMPYASASWDCLLDIGGELVQPKAVEFARDHNLSFLVAASGGCSGTWVGPFSNRLAPADEQRPLRVALCGLGRIGLVVYRWLRREHKRFEVTGIAVDRLDVPRPDDVESDLLTLRPGSLLDASPDMLIDLNGSAPRDVVAAALDGGIAVITNDRELLGERPDLLETARIADTVLRVSQVTSGGTGAATLAIMSHIMEILRTRTGGETPWPEEESAKP